jgi:hypothetical protein
MELLPALDAEAISFPRSASSARFHSFAFGAGLRLIFMNEKV